MTTFSPTEANLSDKRNLLITTLRDSRLTHLIPPPFRGG